MSYTPDNQLLEQPLRNAVNALVALQSPIQERLRNPSEWNAAHLEELRVLFKRVSDLELDLRLLSNEVR